MIETTIKILDQTIGMIKSKDDNDSFNPQALKKFELCFFVCLEIARFELETQKVLSNETGSAISFLFAFRCFEYYYRDYPEVYSKTSELFSEFIKYNVSLRNNELSFAGQVKENWIEYIHERLNYLFSNVHS